MGRISKFNQEYINWRMSLTKFENIDDSECVEDLVAGYGCTFYAFMVLVFVVVLVIINEVSK